MHKKIKCPPGFTSHYTKVFEHNVHAFSSAEKSSGKPNIILIHGAIASRRYLMPTAQRLLDSFNVYVPDLPGHGHSSKPRNVLNVEQQAEVLDELIQLNNIAPTHILANSYGTQIAVELAVEHADLVGSMILVGPTADLTEPTLTGHALRLLMNGLFEKPWTPFMIARDVFDMGFIRAVKTGRRMMEYPLPKKLSRIRANTLVMRGSKDTICSEEWAESIALGIPGAQYALVPGSPHNVNYSASIQLSALTKRFILSAPATVI